MLKVKIPDTATASQPVLSAVSNCADAAEAARELHAVLSQTEAACVIFFCCIEYDLRTLARSLAALFGNTPVVGCTTAGEITPNGLSHGSITGFCLPADQFVVETTLLNNLAAFSEEDAHDSIKAMVQRLRSRAIAPLETHSFALSLLDGMSIREELVLNALNTGLNDIPLVGGSAGDNLHFRDTQIYYNDRFYSNAAVMLIVNTVCPFRVVSSDHLTPEQEKLVVTRADPSRRVVYEFNAEPAALEYCRIMGLSLEQLNSRIFALYPLAVQLGENIYIRSIQDVNDDLSVTFFCAIDTGIVLTKMHGGGLLEHFSAMMSEVVDAIGEPQITIGYDCIHRRIEVEERGLKEELSRLYQRYRVIGFNTYGEQRDAMHVNHTFSGVAIGVAGGVSKYG